MKTRLMIIIALLIGILFSAQIVSACTPTPVAVLTVTPNNAGIEKTVIFDGNSSYATGKTITKYEWDWTNDGTYDYTETADDAPDGIFDGITTHSYDTAGVYTAKLRVTDSRDLTVVTTCVVHVGQVGNLTKGLWYSSIQSAINDANSNDVIEVPQGKWNEAIDFGGKSITVRSTEPNNWNVVGRTIVDSDGLDSDVVTFDSGETSSALLKGLTLKHGNAGVYCGSSSSPIINHCFITDNNSYGIQVVSGSPLLTHNKVVGNCGGEGIYSSSSTPPTIKYSLICKNFKGIRFASANSSVMIRNNTIADNNGIGIEVVSGTEPNISNCVLWNNTKDMNGCSAAYSCIKDVNDANGVGNITSDPRFWGVDSNDYYLMSESPCVTSGDPNQSYTGEIDLYGRDVNAVTPQVGATSVNKWKVRLGGQGHSPQTSWNTWYAFGNLKSALSTTTNPGLADGDEIWVAAGTYAPGTSAFQIPKAITLYGGFNNTTPEIDPTKRTFTTTNETKLDGVNTCDNIFVGPGKNLSVVIDGFTITRAKGTGYYCANSYITVRNCAFSYNMYTGLTFDECPTAVVTNCSFLNNEAPAFGGGGLVIYSSSLTYDQITNCVFAGNIAHTGSEGGGGLYCNSNINLTLTNCVFRGNQAPKGGGIYLDVLSDNGSNPQVINCTFSNNTTGTGGAGGGLYDYWGSATITNSIFWGNQASSGAQIGYSSQRYLNYPITYNCIQGGGFDGEGNIAPDDPGFVNSGTPAGGDGIWGTMDDGLELTPDSPCRSQGNRSAYMSGMPNTDVAGCTRISGCTIDMGAYERWPYLIAVGWFSAGKDVRKYNLGNVKAPVWSAFVGSGGSYYYIVAVDSQGNVFVNTAGDVVYKLKPDLTLDDGWQTNGTYTVETGKSINSLAVDSSDNLYVGYAADNNLQNPPPDLTKITYGNPGVASPFRVTDSYCGSGVKCLAISKTDDGDCLWVESVAPALRKYSCDDLTGTPCIAEFNSQLIPSYNLQLCCDTSGNAYGAQYTYQGLNFFWEIGNMCTYSPLSGLPYGGVSPNALAWARGTTDPVCVTGTHGNGTSDNVWFFSPAGLCHDHYDDGSGRAGLAVVSDGTYFYVGGPLSIARFNLDGSNPLRPFVDLSDYTNQVVYGLAVSKK